MDVLTLVAKIILDLSGYEKNLKKAQDDFSQMGKNLKKVQDDFSSIGKNLTKAGRNITDVGTSLTNHITKPALAATAAIGGIFLVKGWNRLTQIDDAKAKLRALGNSADDVSRIMESALTSVKGTAYGMDEAATTAASAVAAGISMGEDLTKYLTSVADTAAIAGTGMSDMGLIFNKVVTTGKAQNEVLTQLAERGIPIYQWLAEVTGQTAEGVADMASKGEISLKTFREAVEKHVGGAAKELGNATLTGAIANVWAAVSRVGANFLGAADDANTFAGKLRPVIIKVQDWLGGLEEKAKEWGAVFGEVFGALIEWIETGEADLSKMSETAQSVWNTLKPTLEMIRDIATAIRDIWGGMSDSQRAAFVKLSALSVTLGPILKLVGSLVIGLGSLSKGLSDVTGWYDKFAGGSTVAAKGAAEVAKQTAKVGEAAAKTGTEAAKQSGILSGLMKNLKWVLEVPGVATTAVMTGIIELGDGIARLSEKLRGGNQVMTEFGGGLHSLEQELVSSGKITNKQADELYKTIEGLETAGASGEKMVQGVVDKLKEFGVSSEDAKTAVANLAGQNMISADSFNALNSKVETLSAKEVLAGKNTRSVVENFSQLQEAVARAGEQMRLSDSQISSLNGAMLNADGSTKTLTEAYSSLMEMTELTGVNTEKFAAAMGVTVPGATKKADNAIKTSQNTTSSFSTVIASLAKTTQDTWNKGSEILRTMQNSVKSVFDSTERTASQKAASTASGVINGLKNLPTSVGNIFQSIGSTISTKFQSITNTVSSGLKSVSDTFTTKFQSITSTVTSGMKSVADTVTDKMKSVDDTVTAKMKSVADTMSDKMRSLTDTVTAKMKSVADTVTDKMKSVADTVSNKLSSMNTTASSGLSTTQTTFSNAFTSIQTSVTNITQKIGEKFTSSTDSATTWGKDLVQNLTNGLKDSRVMNTLEATLKNIAQKIKDYLGFSEPKEGPLSDFHTYAPDMMALFTKGIKENEYLVRDQISKSFDFSNLIKAPQNISATGSAGAVGGAQYVQYVNITSPKAMDAIETARLTRNATRDMILSLNVG